MISLLNSSKVNQALMEHAEAYLESEKTLKLKAQMIFMEEKYQRRMQSDKSMFSFNNGPASDNHLWGPTKMYYFATFVVFAILRKRFSLSSPTFFLFLSIPLCADHLSKFWLIV